MTNLSLFLILCAIDVMACLVILRVMVARPLPGQSATIRPIIGRWEHILSNYQPVLQVHPSVYIAPLNDELALLNAETGTYFGLNPVGAHIWDLLSQGMSPGNIALMLVDEYDVEHSTLLHDITLLVEDLQRHGLLQCDASHGS